MKKELLTKLKNYSKTAAAMAAIGGTANAQIVYTDVHPDTTLNTFSSNYEIDFDNDGAIDVNVNMGGFSTSFAVKASPVNSMNQFIVTTNYIGQLSANFLISSNATFNVGYGYGSELIKFQSFSGTSILYGNWTNTDVIDKYVGFKFEISGGTHYGWIRLSTHYVDYSNVSVTIKDFAYQSIPDSSIYAGAFDSLQFDLGNDTILCYGDSLQLTAPSGYFSYNWSTGQLDTNSIYATMTGNYYVTVQDGPEGPVGVDSIYIEISSEIISQVSNYTEPKCFGDNTGFIELTTAGGTAPFSYTWQAHPDTNRIENLSAGDYFVTISDINNCFIDTFITINQPNDISVNFSSDIFCGGCNGQITANAMGGYPPYQYIWASGNGQTVTDLCEGTYTVTIIDDSLCVKALDYQITESALANISGFLNYTGGNIIAGDARVELYKDTIAGASQLELKDSVYTETGGYFEFMDIIPESFYIRAVITSSNTNYDDIYTSYYSNIATTTMWTSATLITLTCEDTLSNINFNMYELAAPITGPGIFSGTIVYGDGSQKSFGEPVSGAEVFVEQEPNDEPIANTETDTIGDWVIDNIPVGTGYHLIVDIPGLPLMSTYQNLEVGSSSEINNLNFFVDTLSNGGIFTDTTTGIISVNNEIIEVKTFPNPVTNNFTIETFIKNNEQVSFSIIDINGKELIISEDKYYQGKYIEQINISDFENGIFYLKLRIGNAVYIRKIVKQ